jgi:hypothetical protein
MPTKLEEIVKRILSQSVKCVVLLLIGKYKSTEIS